MQFPHKFQDFYSIKILFFLAALLIAGAPKVLAQAPEFAASDSDGVCPAGYQLATPAEARANQDAACAVLGTWYIARLAGGGSMDGPGYNCKIRDADSRPLGNSLCRRSAALAKFVASDRDGVCPAGYVLASSSEARDNKDQACGVLGTWYIARLAGGGSMDGSGYNCKIRDADSRPLGNSLCRLGAAAQYGGDSACIADTLTPAQNAGANTASWVKGNETYATRSNFSGLSGGFANEAFAEEAARNYCSGQGYDWSLPQLRTDADEAHMDVQCCSKLSVQNSTAPANITAFVNDVVNSSTAVDEITKAESLADIYLLTKSLGHNVSKDQLSSIAQDAQKISKRSAPCGGLGEPACTQCVNSVTVYFPFNFCCIPTKTQCLEYSPITHCDPGLTPSSGRRRGAGDTCDIDRRSWKDTSIDRKRTGPNCGGTSARSCWQVDDQDRDRLETDTSKLNFVTALGPDQTVLPASGQRFIYVYRKADERVVLRNYDRDDPAYMYPGNCRQQSDYGAYGCNTDSIRGGRYLHVRHSQLNHAPGTPANNNWDPVWCAGEMRIENGRICLINNESGHFQPLAACTEKVAQTLQAWGVPTAPWLVNGDFRDYSASKTCAQLKDEL